MTYNTALYTEGIDIPISIDFKKVIDESHSKGWFYELIGITIEQTEDEFLELSQGDGTSTEYNKILDTIERGDLDEESIEKVYNEYQE